MIIRSCGSYKMACPVCGEDQRGHCERAEETGNAVTVVCYCIKCRSRTEIITDKKNILPEWMER